MIPGGLTEAKPATPEIQEIANMVKPQLEEKTNETYEEFTAIEYKTQVVAGINYYIKIQTGDNRYIHIKVFKSLPQQSHSLILTGYQVDKTKDDELAGF
ncbi:cystatin-A [Bos indicus]|uniref:Cystatin A n=3 Tax=Bos TaxID=9903 RepID=A0AAA9SQW3_BOVIN|nr:cystatin-A [Bos taurus]XP_019823263.1 PREDICTED: cystatin-A [Bos indicus]DAA33447.1 TPA: cystatin-A [Bos taurus]